MLEDRPVSPGNKNVNYFRDLRAFLVRRKQNVDACPVSKQAGGEGMWDGLLAADMTTPRVYSCVKIAVRRTSRRTCSLRFFLG
jgi:hypothetical protein